VLIDATAPFGFGHALPRGLLREPLSGLERADAFVRTRVDQADPATLSAIDSELRSRNRDAPIYQSRHVMRSLLAANGDSIAPEQLRGRRMLAFCGIGNPQSFNAQLTDLGAVVVGLEAFADHHDYSEPDMTGLNERARSAGAEFLVTTEKDWAKVEKLAGWISLPLWRVGLDIEIEDGGLPLLRQIAQKAPMQLSEASNTQDVGNLLYGQYMLSFEIASLLLLVAIVGAVVMAKKRI